MEASTVTFAFFLIFSGAAVLASVALYTRQPLIIAYVALGALIGPYGFSLVTDLQQLSAIGHIGIIFLLSFAFSVSFGCVEGFDVGIDVVCHQLDACRPITDVGVRDGVCWGERRPDKVA